MENFRIAQSNLNNTAAAVLSIKEQLSGIDAGMVLFFSSPSYSPMSVGRIMSEVFADARTIGCTTAGEMALGKMGQNAIVAMAWSKEALKDLKIEILENVKEDVSAAVDKAFKSFEQSTGTPMRQLDPAQYVGMVLVDGLSGCEEKLNDRLGTLTNIVFVGGSAGDNFKFENTWLFVDGKAYTDAAILLLMQPANGYTILKTQSFEVTGKMLTATKVDEARRTIIEFDGKPAAEAYAETLGITLEKLDVTLGEHPVALVYDENNFFVRSPMKLDGTAIVFYCSVKEKQKMTVLKSGDIVATTRKDLDKVISDCGGKIQAVVDFNCCLRTSELNRKNQLKDYADIFADVPAIGFATYGESYIGHINQTSTMLILK